MVEGANDRKLKAKDELSVCSSYRIILEDAAYVIAKMILIDILADETYL